MNQILKPDINKQHNHQHFSTNSSLDQKTKFSKMYKLQFVLSAFIAFCFLIAFFVRVFKSHENERLSQELMGIYQTSTLYANTTDYEAQTLDSSQLNSSNTPFVIGMLKIDKISLNYPILSKTSKDLLDVSICRFAGPMPNEPRKLVYCWSQLC